METLTIRVYTFERGYHSSREIKIDIEELRDWIKENKLKSNQMKILNRFHLKP